MNTSKDRGVDIWRSPLPPLHVWSARSELAVMSGATYRLTPDQSISSDISNIDPWSIEIERASPAHPASHSPPVGLTSLQLDDPVQRAAAEASPRTEEPRIGRVPFPVVDSGSSTPNRQSSLSATRKLVPSRQESHTPTRRRSPSRSTQRPRHPMTHNDSRPHRAIETHLAVSGSLKLSSPRPLGEMAKVMRTDISEVMRARVMCGYGVDSVNRVSCLLQVIILMPFY